MPCTLVYVDIGANVGDSLIDFARRKVEDNDLGAATFSPCSHTPAHMYIALATDLTRPQQSSDRPFDSSVTPPFLPSLYLAHTLTYLPKPSLSLSLIGLMLHHADPSWSPASTCVYAFEPNPRHTLTLQSVRKSLMGDFSSLEVFTETAVVGGTETRINFAPSADANSVSGHVGVANGVSIRALNLAEWLQNDCAARHPRLPIVLRMDIEAQEYMVLMDLVLSGAPRTIQRRFNSSLYLAVEWHRYKKHEALGGERCALMNKFDLKTRFFNRGAGLPPRGVDPYVDPNWKHKLRNKRCVTLNVPSRNTNHPTGSSI